MSGICVVTHTDMYSASSGQRRYAVFCSCHSEDYSKVFRAAWSLRPAALMLHVIVVLHSPPTVVNLQHLHLC